MSGHFTVLKQNADLLWIKTVYWISVLVTNILDKTSEQLEN